MRKLSLVTALLGSLSAAEVRAGHAAIVVASDGSGQFQTVQAAIDSIPDGNAESRLVVVKPGHYREQVVINSRKPFITLRGVDPDARKTVLSFDRYATVEDPKAPGKRVGIFGTESVSIEANDFTAENITFENSAGRLAPAMALRATGDKLIFRNCRFLSWQDTVCLVGHRMYFRDCYFEGRVDFIIGHATAVFEKCHLHATDGGVIAAPSTSAERPFGLVFLKCRVTCKEDRSYLAAPWQPGAAAAFIECELGENLWPEGWTEWRGAEHHKTARFVEYKNTGPGAVVHRRPSWTRQLTEAEAKNHTVQNILRGPDQWDPTR
ncbi:MAG TPA: pectinesterase family protein [Chthoniobacterales bacterium]|nr:pectinesterase family protein [Chthoniobacterales bacterium]